MRAPATLLVLVIHAAVILAAGVLALALAMPSVGVRFTETGTGYSAHLMDGREIALSANATVDFVGGSGGMRQTARELVNDFSPDGSPTAIATWFAARDRLGAIVVAGDASLAIAGHPAISLRPQARDLGDLPTETWQLLLQGILFALLAAWLIAAKPRDDAARIFAISCAGLVAASFSGALYDARELAADGLLLHVLQTVNFTGSYVAASALIALFLTQPRRLITTRTAFSLIAAAAIWGLLCGIGWLPLSAFYLGLLPFPIAFVVGLSIQWIRSRGEPAARATVRWIGLTSLIGNAQLVIAMAAPRLLDLPSFGSDGSTIVPLTIVYGSIAFGIGRNRMFDLDRWTYRVMLGALATLGFLAVDAALVGFLRLDGPIALALTLMAIGYLYLPLRALVWRSVAGRDAISDSDKFQFATEVAFAATPAARREGWHALLRRLFDPLAIETASALESVAIEDGGAVLAVPAIADETALRLRHRAGGNRLFGPDQVRLAGEIVSLMRRAETARAEYDRGVGEERQRIARDLHDDVCATLLTGLHRDEVGKVRTDIRSAMTEIRTVISGLSDERVPVDQALADLRYEIGERLAAARVALDWPLPVDPYPATLLDYSTYRGLVSSHREAVSNILKHAGATSVRIDIAILSGLLSSTIADDGRRTWDTDAARAGHGVTNMRHRLSEIGGTFDVSSGNSGTCVAISLPLPANVT